MLLPNRLQRRPWQELIIVHGARTRAPPIVRFLVFPKCRNKNNHGSRLSHRPIITSSSAPRRGKDDNALLGAFFLLACPLTGPFKNRLPKATRGPQKGQTAYYTISDDSTRPARKLGHFHRPMCCLLLWSARARTHSEASELFLRVSLLSKPGALLLLRVALLAGARASFSKVVGSCYGLDGGSGTPSVVVVAVTYSFRGSPHRDMT